jgi:hypothetical protein
VPSRLGPGTTPWLCTPRRPALHARLRLTRWRLAPRAPGLACRRRAPAGLAAVAPMVEDGDQFNKERSTGKTGNRQESTNQFDVCVWVGGGKMDISHAQSHMSVRPNGGFLTDRGRNGIVDKEV